MAFSPFFRIGEQLWGLPASERDQEVRRQKEAVSEDELRADACKLMLDLATDWLRGVYTVVGFGELLEEKRRRLLATGDHDADQLAAWLRTCLQTERDRNVAYLPNADDCAALVNDIARCGDDGCGRPGFLDIAK